MLKKILMVAFLAITTHCYIAAPAEAGNSIRLRDASGWGITDSLCDPITCDADTEIVIWNEANQCFDCLACADNEVVVWNSATPGWECRSGPGDPTADAVCIDGTTGDFVIMDDGEVLDDFYVGDVFGVNTCETTKDIGGTTIAANESHTFHVINSMFNGATANNSPENNLMLEAHIDSVINANVLGFTRYYNAGAGDLANNWGLEIGRIQAYGWNGVDHQPQAAIRFIPDTDYDTGAMADDEMAGTICFTHGEGKAGSGGTYSDSACAKYTLSWEFNSNVTLSSGVIGFGSHDLANAVCIIDDGADRIFHDVDCDGVKDSVDEYIDIPKATEEKTWDAPSLYCSESVNCPPTLLDNNTNVDIYVIGFDDTTQEQVNGKFVVPEDISTTGADLVTFSAYFSAAGASCGVNCGVVWEFEWVANGQGEDFDDTYTTETDGGQDASGTTTVLSVASWTESITNLVWTAGEIVHFRVLRAPADGNDTLSGDAYLHAFKISFPMKD